MKIFIALLLTITFVLMVTVGVKKQPDTQSVKITSVSSQNPTLVPHESVTKSEPTDSELAGVPSKYDQNKILEHIPRSMADSATYFLIYLEQVGPQVISIHKRVSSTSTGYSKLLINCDTHEFKRLGYSESEMGKLTDDDFDNTNTKWEDLTDGSSKADTVKYVCNRSRD